MNTKYLFLFLTVFISTSLSSQETLCGDGIDNDGDGLIDCYDLDCDDQCDNSFFYGVDTPTCIFIPLVEDTFLLEEIFRTPDAVDMDARQIPVVGDMDGDGIPEILGKNDEVINSVYVFSGIDGSIKDTIPAPALDRFAGSLAIADVDGDGFGEVFMVAQNRAINGTGSRRLFGFTYNDVTDEFDTLFVSNTLVGYTADADRNGPSIADFNEDGIPEVYIGNKIWNALTGAELAAGGSANSMGENVSAEEYLPVAFDVLESASCTACDGLELIAGNMVYSLDFSNPSAWVMNVEFTAATGLNDGYTSIADFDKDGDVDGIVVAGGDVYVWNLQDSTQIGITHSIVDNFPVSAGCTKTPGNTNRGGRANVADFDGDGDQEIGVAGRNVYVVIENDMTQKWAISSCDGSQKTGSTVFDFEGDGKAEVVYKDERELFVLDGTTGNIIARLACVSATRLEYPLVVDINRDGQAEICASCGGAGGYFSVFRSPNQSWVSSRRVWNQHAYFNTNINDDLSIPPFQQKHNIVGDSVILNNFLVQATYLKMDGQPAFSAPDDSVAINSFDISDCQNQDGTNQDTVITNITVFNTGNGSWLLPAGTKVSLYNGDPFVGTSAIYLTTIETDSTLNVGESETINVPFIDPEVAINLTVVVNDNGTGTLPLTEPITNIGECDYTNNKDDISITECLVDLLPIVLLDFSAKRLEERILIEWITETEINNDYFEVEKSQDGMDFEPILFQKGQGNSTNTVYYHDFDYELNKSTIYYRLKQVDYNGDFSYSNIISIDPRNLTKQKTLSLHPNPTKDYLKINDLPNNASLIVYNQLGAEVLQLSNSSGLNYYDVSQLTKGIYLLQVKTSLGEIFGTERFAIVD